jgi:hypothetical protein
MKARQAVLGALAAAVMLTVVALVFAVPAAADAPTEIPFEFVFDDVNPCTGHIHTVTIAGTTSVHDHDGRIVAYSKRTITTSPTGFVGRGTDTYVLNGRVEMFSQADILTSPPETGCGRYSSSCSTRRPGRCGSWRAVWLASDRPDPDRGGQGMLA